MAERSSAVCLKGDPQCHDDVRTNKEVWGNGVESIYAVRTPRHSTTMVPAVSVNSMSTARPHSETVGTPTEHSVAPGPDVVPAGQGAQNAEPGKLAKVSARHTEQMEEPVSDAKDPGGQGVHSVDPAELAKNPRSHGVHGSLPVALNSPAGQTCALADGTANRQQTIITIAKRL